MLLLLLSQTNTTPPFPHPHPTHPHTHTHTHKTKAHVLLEQHQSEDAHTVLRRLQGLFPRSPYLIVRCAVLAFCGLRLCWEYVVMVMVNHSPRIHTQRQT